MIAESLDIELNTRGLSHGDLHKRNVARKDSDYVAIDFGISNLYVSLVAPV